MKELLLSAPGDRKAPVSPCCRPAPAVGTPSPLPDAAGRCCPTERPIVPDRAPQPENPRPCCPPETGITPDRLFGSLPGGSCCPPGEDHPSCCRPPAASLPEIPGFRRWHFVTGFVETPLGPVPAVSTGWRRPDVLGQALVRLGVGRNAYRVAPGLYAVGSPSAQSPVLVTANFKLTFDFLRRDLAGLDAWILVLDTRGVNVWCAAGKGTFGTSELIGRIRAVGLDRLVARRTVIVPQLGAPGVDGRAVRRATGFRVVFGPVRSADLKAFLAAGMRATPAMRRVGTTPLQRLTVGLVEFSNELGTMAWVLATLFVLAGLGPEILSIERGWSGAWRGFSAYLLGFAAGNLLMPPLLPWLPGRAFARKGALLGAVTGLVFPALAGFGALGVGLWLGVVVSGSWYGMNYTGSSTFTSPSGVEREMRLAIPCQAAGLLLSVILWRIGLGG